MTITKRTKSKAVTAIDWILFAVLAVVCYFCFNQGDIRHTAGSSFGYLSGHIKDFYDYNGSLGLGDAYMPSTYILFAIWNIPIKLLGLVTGPTMSISVPVLQWNKLMPTLFFFGCAYLMRRILQLLNASERQVRIGTYLFLSSPIAFFSQFMFGQYDSITLFFMMLGIYYWIKNRDLPFILSFAFALTFKYTALLVFVPLLMLKEKRYWRVILSCVLVMIPIMFMIAFYIRSESFRYNVFGFGAVSYILSVSFKATYFPISVVVVLWLMICGVAFFHDCKTRAELCQWGVFLASLVCLVIFGLCQWHPQWLMFMTPFLVLGAIYNNKAKEMLFFEFLLMVAYVVVSATMWSNQVDQRLFEWGIFRPIVQQKGEFVLTMRQLFLSVPLILTYSTFFGLLLIMTVYKHPYFLRDRFSESLENAAAMIRVRFLGGLAVFLVPACICFAVLLKQPDLIVDCYPHYEPMETLTEESDVRQYFTGPDFEMTRIGIYITTYDHFFQDGTLMIDVFDAETDTKIAGTSRDLYYFAGDDLYFNVDIDPMQISEGKQYYLKFYLLNANEETTFCLYRIPGGTATETRYAMLDGEAQNFNLCVCLYGNTD